MLSEACMHEDVHMKARLAGLSFGQGREVAARGVTGTLHWAQQSRVGTTQAARTRVGEGTLRLSRDMHRSAVPAPDMHRPALLPRCTCSQDVSLDWSLSLSETLTTTRRRRVVQVLRMPMMDGLCTVQHFPGAYAGR